MKKRVNGLIAAGLLLAFTAGCEDASPTAETPSAQADEVQQETADVQGAEQTPDTAESEGAQTDTEAGPAEGSETSAPAEPVTVRIGALKGPTSIGLAGLIYENEDSTNIYEYTMETQADVILAGVIAGDFDIALVPANVASVLYQKTEGQITAVDINTLGVLYMVSGDQSIAGLEDLSGRTVYTTGKGNTPEYVLNYLLEEKGLTGSVNVEFKSEATEVAATLAADPSAVGMLPQPFATVAQVQNESLAVVLDMTGEWDALGNGSQMVTGVTIVRNDFLEAHPDAVDQFLADHEASVNYVNTDTEQAAEYVAEMGIIEKPAVAQKAIPYCNIVCIEGEEMKTALSGYLEVLYAQDPSSVGGALPDDAFYLK